MKKHNTSLKYLYIYVLFSIFYFWLASQISYTHDDWDWGLEIGMQHLVSADINSRYAGNFFEVLMTRSSLLKTIIMGLTYSLLPLLTASVATRSSHCDAKESHLAVYILSNFLFLTMNQNIFRQTYGWIAGFANFAVSSLPLAVYLYEIISVFDSNPSQRKESALKTVALFLLSIVMQLFIENLTLFMVLLSILVCVVCWAHEHRVHRKYIVMLAGNVIGAGIMFSSSVYRSLLTEGTAVEGYRRLVLGQRYGFWGSVSNLFKQCATLVAKTGLENHVLCIVILLLLTCLLIKGRDHLAPIAKKLFLLSNFVLICYSLLVSQLDLNTLLGTGISRLLRGLVSGIYIVIAFVETVMLYRHQKQHLFKLLLLWFSAQMVVLPVAVTSESGDRLFFTSNFFVILFALHLLLDAIRDLPEARVSRLRAVMLAALLIVCGNYARIFSAIGNCSAQRTNLIDAAICTNAKEIELPAYPYEEYLWGPNPTDEQRWAYFKEFYGIPSDIEITIK